MISSSTAHMVLSVIAENGHFEPRELLLIQDNLCKKDNPLSQAQYDMAWTKMNEKYHDRQKHASNGQRVIFHHLKNKDDKWDKIGSTTMASKNLKLDKDDLRVLMFDEYYIPKARQYCRFMLRKEMMTLMYAKYGRDNFLVHKNNSITYLQHKPRFLERRHYLEGLFACLNHPFNDTRARQFILRNAQTRSFLCNGYGKKDMIRFSTKIKDVCKNPIYKERLDNMILSKLVHVLTIVFQENMSIGEINI